MEILHKAATTTLAWREIKGIPKQGYNPVWTPPCIIFNWEIPQIIKKYSKLVWKNWLQHFSESLCKDNAVQVLKDLEKKTCQTRNISCLTFWSKWLLIIQENFWHSLVDFLWRQNWCLQNDLQRWYVYRHHMPHPRVLKGKKYGILKIGISKNETAHPSMKEC